MLLDAGEILNSLMAVNADPSETPVSHNKRLDNLQVLISDNAWMS
jgi:hypothetical protein